MNYTPPTFFPQETQDWKDFLEREGYVVLSDVLSPEEKETSFQLFKDDWQTISSGFSWDDQSTWTIKNSPMMFGKGMAVFNGFGQSDFMWSLRTNPKIYSVFQKIYSEDDLVVSMDGFSVFLSDQQKSKSWLHVDQNPKNDIYSIQGAYNFLPVGEQDAGFIVVPKSHKEFRPTVTHSKDWIVIDQETFYPQAKKLNIPENCLVLWNSKTIHSNQGMSKGRSGFNRLTTYLTYQPKTKRPEYIKQKRIGAYMNGKTTSHWSNKCELKRYPFGFKTNYEKKGFGEINPKLDDSGNIPEERMKLI